MDHVKILDTTELLDSFEADLGTPLGMDDHLELFHQLFQLLDQTTPMQLMGRKILAYDRLVFANHLKVDEVAVDRFAWDLLNELYRDLYQKEFYVNGALMYFPFSMNGYDLCVRRYNS